MTTITDNGKILKKKYNQAIKDFLKTADIEGYAIMIYKHELRNNETKFGKKDQAIKTLNDSQIENRILLLGASQSEGRYISSMKNHANMFSATNKSSSSPSTISEGSTDIESLPSTHSDRPKSKKRKFEAFSSPDLNYSKSSIWSDETLDPEKAASEMAQQRKERYANKMSKIVDEDLNDVSPTRRVSFPSNYVLQTQLLKLGTIRSGEQAVFSLNDRSTGKVSPQLETVFTDIPNATKEFKKAPLSIHKPEVKKKGLVKGR